MYRRRQHRPKLRPAALLALLLFAFAGHAQEISGTIEATLDGEAHTWYTLRYQDEEESGNTAEWSAFGEGATAFYTFTVQGHRTERFAVEGTLSLDFASFGLPENCPCTMSEATVMYFASSSMFSDVYVGEETTLILAEIAQLDDETFRLVGEFSGVLFYMEDIMAMEEPDPERTLGVSGSFEVSASRFEID